MRVAFLGNAPWSVPTLEALAKSRHGVAAVVTRKPRPAGRGGALRPTPVADAARALGLPLYEVDTVKSGSGFEALAETEPDVLVVVAYGEIVPPAVLEIPSRMPVNVHFSLLPELRGAAPVQRAILEGLTATGVTTIRMDVGMDTGPILLQETEAIDPEDDAGSLGARLAAIGARLAVDTLDRLESGDLEPRAQDDALANVAPKLRAEDELVDWARPADEVVRRVRALAPSPGARTTFRGWTLKIHRARPGHGAVRGPAGPPGSVVLASKEGLGVMAADGPVLLEEVQVEGRRRVGAGEFVRGYNPKPGEVLGT
jgi:methionyl-tRNA formyltransferase